MVTLGEALNTLQRDIPQLETIKELKNCLREIVKILQVILEPEKYSRK